MPTGGILEQFVQSHGGAALKTDCPGLEIISLPEHVLPPVEGIPTHVRAMNLLRANGFEGLTGQNALWAVTWTFLYWEVVFARIPEGYSERMTRGFPEPPQDIPSDLFTPDFAWHRRELYDARRKELVGRGPGAVFKESINRYPQEPTRLLESLPSLDLAEALRFIEAVPPETLLRILDRLWIDFNANRSGLPHLALYRPAPAMIGIKGPSGSLKANQIDWLRYLAGRCGIATYVLTVGWSDRKLKNLVKKLAGPSGEIFLEYGHSGSKYFQDVEEEVQNSWTVLERDGQGKGLKVRASLPLKAIGQALSVLKPIARWKNARLTLGDRELDRTGNGPIRCLAKKLASFEGTDYCEGASWYGGDRRRHACRLFDSLPLEQGHFEGYGYRDSTKAAFVLNKDKIRSETEEMISELKVCPYFKAKRIQAAVQKLPEIIDPSADRNWAWVDTRGCEWVFIRRTWMGSWGDSDFPGMEHLVSVRQLTPKRRRDIESNCRAQIALQRELEALESETGATVRTSPSRSGKRQAPARKQGCSVLVLAIVVALACLAYLG